MFSSSPFLQFDIDGDGAITSEELRHAIIKLLGEHTSKREIEAVVREADNNGDGTVDFEGETQVHKHTYTQHKKYLIYTFATVFRNVQTHKKQLKRKNVTVI